ncbi:MAG: HAMP domain-containing histidine kinase [Tidjanibacter sp.]|nr:HAMP domain-containing histidine kinase [Tidjanibacter sp.]
MKLSTNILQRIVLPATMLVAIWTVGFYFAILDEVNDEVDDALEEYSETISRRYLAGEPMADATNGTNNSYHIEPLDTMPVAPTLSYSNEDIWIESKSEMEPARVLRTTFVDMEGRGYLLTVMTPTIEKKDLKEALLLWSSLLCLSLVVLVLIVIAIAFHRSLRPLYRLLDWLDRSRFDSSHEPLDNPTNISEFARLNEAVDRYDSQNRIIYQRQSEFIGNASHELQTPLAICSNRLDLLAETPLSESQLAEVLKVQSTLSHLSRLNQSLLLLTKIDNHQFPATEQVDVGQLIRRKLEELQEIYSGRGITVEVQESRKWQFAANGTLMDIAVTNLVKNAFVHNRPQGRIEVRIDDKGLSITNTGDATPLDGERVFSRFYQPHKREGSTGLGLAIVASISQRNGHTISYDYTPEGLHTFSIRENQ